VPRPLRFCHLSIFYPPYSFGGDAMYLYRLVNALAERGHEVDVIHCVDSYHALEPRQPTGNFPNHPNVTVHTLRSGWGRLSPLLSQQTGGVWFKKRRILEVFLGKKFDVIHYHNISLFGPRVLTLAPDYSDFIKLYTTHEHWLVCPMHVLWKNNQRLCEKPDCFRCTLAFRRPPQWWRYTRLLERCAAAVDSFISPSRFTRQMLHDRGFVREIAHLPYFVPDSPELLAPPRAPAAAADVSPNIASPDSSPHSRPYFLFVGRLEKIKGLQDVIPLFRDYPHADLRVAGTGNFEHELRRQAEGMTNVIFLGSLQQDRLRALYRHAIAALVPSICYEVFGIIILEAYMQRTPVIVHRLGGLEEVVEESRGGFAYGTSGELLAAMEQLRTNPALRAEMGQRGFLKYQERWNTEAHLALYFAELEAAALRKLGRVPWLEPSRVSLAWSPAANNL
jgi:glycosyltransferase involved in cell wall biosynthesis